MKPLEDELRRALRRVDPPAGFTSRVMARVAQGERPKPKFAWLRFFSAWTVPKAVWSLAATAAILVLVVSAVAWRERRIREEQRRGELARAQVMEALHITTVKLNRVRSRVREATQDGTRGLDRGKGSRTSRSSEQGHLAELWKGGSRRVWEFGWLLDRETDADRSSRGALRRGISS